MSQNTIMQIYRVVGGRRIPYILELDATMTVVVDRPDTDHLHAITQSTLLHNTVQSAIAPVPPVPPVMQGEVISKTELPGGGSAIAYKPTPADILAGTWVTALVTTNPIPGTDDLRAEYFAADAALKERHAARGATCPSCESGALMRKYRARLEELGYLK